MGVEGELPATSSNRLKSSWVSLKRFNWVKPTPNRVTVEFVETGWKTGKKSMQ